MDMETVAGRLMMTLLSGSGFQMSKTRLQISSANSGSVPVKLSGEYSKRIFPFAFFRYPSQSFAPNSAMPMISSLDFLKTCSRCATEVEL